MDLFKENIGEYYGLIVGFLILMPFAVGLFISFINYHKDYWTQFMGYLLGIVFIVFGYATLPDRLNELNVNRKDKWEKMQFISNKNDSYEMEQKRQRAFEQKRAIKLLEAKANEIRFNGEPEWFQSKLNNYILFGTGAILCLFTYIDHRYNQTLQTG